MKVTLSPSLPKDEFKHPSHFPIGAYLVSQYDNTVWMHVWTVSGGSGIVQLESGNGLPSDMATFLYRALRPGELVTIETE